MRGSRVIDLSGICPPELFDPLQLLYFWILLLSDCKMQISCLYLIIGQQLKHFLPLLYLLILLKFTKAFNLTESHTEGSMKKKIIFTQIKNISLYTDHFPLQSALL